MTSKITKLFIFSIFLFFSSYAETKKTTPDAEEKGGKKALLSYALPSTLDWKEKNIPELPKEIKAYSLGNNNEIKLITSQVENTQLFKSIASLSDDDIKKQMNDAKSKSANELAISREINQTTVSRPSPKEIIVTLSGDAVEKKTKNGFVDKYYVTPYGMIFTSLEWVDSVKKPLLVKARKEFDNIKFTMEIQ